MKSFLKKLGSIVFPQGARWLVVARSSFNFEGEVGDGTGSATVMAPLNWIKRTFPEAPPMLWRLLNDGQEEPDATHDLLRLLTKPNPFYGGVELWMATLMDFNVDGNAYWLKLRNNGGAGAVAQLWWVPSWMMEPKGDEATFITHYDYSPRGVPIRLDPNDVVHFRFGLDPEDPRKGESQLKSVLREVFTDDEAANFTAQLLRNMGVPGMVVSPDGDAAISEADAEATKAFMRTAFSGDKRGEPLVMSGKTKVSVFGFSPEQMNLREIRRVPEERVCAVLGVPAIVAGLGAGLDRSTFANYAEAREAAYEDNIIPTQRILSEQLRHQLLPDFEADPMVWRFGFDTKNVRVLQEDENKKSERLIAGVGAGLVKRSEYRRAFGFDVDDADDVYLLPLNIVEVAPGTSPEGDAATPVAEDPAAAAAGAGKGAKAKRTSRHGEAQRRLVQLLAKQARQLESVFSEEMESFFDELGKSAADAVQRTPGFASRANGNTKANDDQTVDQVLQAMAIAAAEESKTKRFRQHYTRTAEQTVSAINTVMELGVELSDPMAVEITRRGGKRAGLIDLDKQTRDALYRALADGRENGVAGEALAMQVREYVAAGPYPNGGARYRSLLIARTETKYAQNVSSITAYKESDAVTGLIAFDNATGNDDADCVARDGQVFSFEDAEAETEAEHPNGTLSWAPATADLVGV